MDEQEYPVLWEIILTDEEMQDLNILLNVLKQRHHKKDIYLSPCDLVLIDSIKEQYNEQL